MKTKSPSDDGPVITLVAFSPFLVERIRASLRRGPFHFRSIAKPAINDDSDLFVVPVENVADLPQRGIPVIACGPPELLRTAFLAGCADYLREPWLPEELSWRARAVVDRAGKGRVFSWGEMQLQGNELGLSNGRIVLTRNETLILKALLRVRGRPVPRESLAALLGGRRGGAGSRTIDVQIAAIRRKVRAAAPQAGRLIVCARGEGYLIP